jgi:peptidyl-prolyl cis-trans isomerase NIMA-interacting 1
MSAEYDLPPGWQQRVSKSHHGRAYFVNKHTGETQWDLPTEPAQPTTEKQVQCLHILKKHAGSRRPASWRCTEITQSKEESISQINAYRKQLEEVLDTNGYEAMEALFREIASVESDCGSAQRGGDLGMFARGQMQKPFEDASFALGVQGLSPLVDSDSGIHIILRIL